MQLVQSSYDKITLDNLLDYCEYHLKTNPQKELEIDEPPAPVLNEEGEAIETGEIKPIKYKKSQKVVIRPEIKAKNEEFCSKFLLSADDLAINLMHSKLKNIPPNVDDLLTNIVEQSYVDDSIYRIRNTESFLLQLCEYVAQ